MLTNGLIARQQVEKVVSDKSETNNVCNASDRSVNRIHFAYKVSSDELINSSMYQYIQWINISTRQLKLSPALHRAPINVLISHESHRDSSSWVRLPA